ncbi:MAG: nitroreductase family protein [Sandaracinus sp.]|nr:nitroreductase family protein [Sandaracinus sp.]MCB9633591.1 nitroreductase family protein [Sandaracinus sp.]
MTATVPLAFERLDEDTMRERAERFLAVARRRRSVRHFATDPIPLDVVERCIEAAAQAPSGANKQPWTFALVTDPEIKRRIRQAAEAEEREFYGGRAPQSWLDDLAHLGTDADKPFLEEAPALIVVFMQRTSEEGARHYYVHESVGLATGFLLAALAHAGLATLTHTPSPMGFLGEILERPEHERPFLLIPVGYPTPDCRVPDITRKELGAVVVRR